MSAPGPAARLAAGAIAATGLFGLGTQLSLSTETQGSLGAALWGMARYYTNLGNLAIALILLAVALGSSRALRPVVMGGALLNSALIGIVYAVLLHDIHLPGESPLAMQLLHYVVPPLVALFWLAFVPRGHLGWRAPLVWAVPPLAYFAYVVTRGAYDGRYPYFFIDVGRYGWLVTLRNAALLTFAFMVFGALVLWIDRLLRPRPGQAIPR